MQYINRVIDFIINLMAGIAAVIMAALLVGICYATFSRFVFNEPLARIVELAAYSLIYITFLAAPWLLKQRGHINVDLILLALKGRAKRGLILFTDFIGAILSAVLFYFSYLITLSNFMNNVRIMDSSNTPQYLLLIAIPISSFFLAIQFIRFIKEDIVALKEGKEGEQ
ncbi:MAG TPA: TRAP transporter small permease [Peptococcaceae bacterium]|nr:TRAP transporter small permease [Peptococcaceae bacterium]